MRIRSWNYSSMEPLYRGPLGVVSKARCESKGGRFDAITALDDRLDVERFKRSGEHAPTTEETTFPERVLEQVGEGPDLVSAREWQCGHRLDRAGPEIGLQHPDHGVTHVDPDG